MHADSEGEEEGEVGIGFSPLPRRQRCSGGRAVVFVVGEDESRRGERLEKRKTRCITSRFFRPPVVTTRGNHPW